MALAAPGPNFTHFPSRVETVDSEFFAQLCAEHRESRYNKGGVATQSIWVQDRQANHALDAMVLALVAFRLLRPNLADMAQRLGAPVAPVAIAPRAETPSPPPAPRATTGPPSPSGGNGRRLWRSGYLGR